jgi:hypothetical protein
MGLDLFQSIKALYIPEENLQLPMAVGLPTYHLSLSLSLLVP